MVKRTSLLLTALLGCVLGSASAKGSSRISGQESEKLSRWYEAVGAPLAGEDFGSYLARSARVHHGASYAAEVSSPGSESLRIDLDRFECVSFIEASLAVARCGYQNARDAACFLRELERSRYRDGRLDGYASRLHYFVDWIADNEARGRLVNLTPTLGGEPLRRDFFHITGRVLQRTVLPGNELASLVGDVSRIEARLSSRSHFVLDRDRAVPALEASRDGDVIAFVRERPGLLVHHAGIVIRIDGEPRLLHASSFHRRVVITSRDVTDYLLRRPERRGVIITRPLPP